MRIAIVSQFLGRAGRWIKELYDACTSDNEVKSVTGPCPDMGLRGGIRQDVIELM
jgi:hypothetical protein